MRLRAALAALLLAATVLLIPASAHAAFPAVRILTLGDSITVGSTETQEVTDSYRAELGAMLDQAGVPHTFVVAAHPGWTCAQWVNLAQAEATADHPDIVIINCGTNDASQGLYGSVEGNYFWLMTNILIGYGPALILPSLIEYSADRLQQGSQQLAVNNAINAAVNNPNEGGAHGTRIIRPIADLRVVPESLLDASTGVHPTAVGGYNTYGVIYYNALRPRFGWPDIAPHLCGMIGHGTEGLHPYLPCNTMPVA